MNGLEFTNELTSPMTFAERLLCAATVDNLLELTFSAYNFHLLESSWNGQEVSDMLIEWWQEKTGSPTTPLPAGTFAAHLFDFASYWERVETAGRAKGKATNYTPTELRKVFAAYL